MGRSAAAGVSSVSERVQAREALRGPSAEQLEDALYDILAVGVDPTPEPGSLEAVQLFLHEHARSRKTHAELLAFFERHGLSYAPERMRAPLPPLALPEVLPPAAISGIDEVPAPERRARPARRRSLAFALGLGAVGAMFVAASVMAYLALSDMRAELSRVRSESASQALQLSRVKQDAEVLRSATQENAELMRKVDHKSDVLIQSLLSPLDPSQH